MRDCAGPWFVYALVDPRDAAIFYVGCSINPQERLRSHSHNWGHPVCDHILAIKGAGLRPDIKIFSSHEKRWEALNEEERQIAKHAETNQLKNRAIPGAQGNFGGHTGHWSGLDDSIRSRTRIAKVWGSL